MLAADRLGMVAAAALAEADLAVEGVAIVAEEADHEAEEEEHRGEGLVEDGAVRGVEDEVVLEEANQ